MKVFGTRTRHRRCPRIVNASQKVARVDMDAPFGSAGDGGGDGAAYSPLERCLTRMEAFAGILPSCPAEHAAIYR